MRVSQGKKALGSPGGCSYSPCSSQCCTRPGTCQSPRFSLGGSRQQGSCGWPGLGARSAGTPGRPCRRRSAGQCAASVTGSAPWAGCLQPSARHQARVPWGGQGVAAGASAFCPQGPFAPIRWSRKARSDLAQREGMMLHPHLHP